MLLDWPTVFFQIINFLILIGLLKRFLYGPVVRAMDDRERQVRERLIEADQKEKAAAQREAELINEQEAFARNRETMQLRAREELEAWKKDALAHLQAEIEQKREAWLSMLMRERETFLYKLKQLVTRNVFQIAKKTLAELADEELEARIVDTFVAKLAQKPDDIGLQLSPSMMTISCITAFRLSEVQKQQLEKTLSAYLVGGRKLVFLENDDLGCGIMLFSDEQKVEWNVHRYMHELEDEIDTALDSFSRGDHG